MGLDMSLVKRPKGEIDSGLETGYWRKRYDLHNYFCSCLKLADEDEYSFIVTRKDLLKFQNDLVRILRACMEETSFNKVYEIYKDTLNNDYYEKIDTTFESLAIEGIKNSVIRTLGIITYNLETCDFNLYDLYYEYSC